MRAIRIGICILLGLTVVSFGGTGSGGVVILEIGAAALFMIWGALVIRLGQLDIVWNWLFLPLLGLLVIATLQYVFGISVYPYLTKMELLKWGSYTLLFFLSTQVFRTEEHQRNLVWFLVSLGFAVALFGIIQHFTFNGKLYWLVSLPDGAAPFGSFVNGDHFAGFVELTAPLGLALLLFGGRRREQLTLLVLFTVLPVGAVILAASRGGIIGLLFEFILLAYLSRAHRIGRRQLLVAGATILLAANFIVWLGIGRAIERFELLANGGISRDLRVAIYRDTWRLFLDHPWVGTGLGTFATVYPQYASFYNGRTVDHAHIDYLELLAETGVVGGFIGASFIALLVWRGFASLEFARSRLARAIIAGSLAAAFGLLSHSLVDFNLQIPSNCLIFLLLAGIATERFREPSITLATANCTLDSSLGWNPSTTRPGLAESEIQLGFKP